MSLPVLSRALLLSSLLLILPSALAWEDHATYKDYPPDTIIDEGPRIQELTHFAPPVVVLSTLPGREDLLEHLQPVVVRNAPIFKLNVKYLLQKGCHYGAIQPDHCGDHCIYSRTEGPFCPRYDPDKLKRMVPSVEGSEVVLESLRRMCLKQRVLGQNGGFYMPDLFFRYLKEFHDGDCFLEYNWNLNSTAVSTAVTGCSYRILKNRFPELPSLKERIDECVNANINNGDQAQNDLLVDDAQNETLDTYRLPLMEFDGGVLQEHTIKTDHAFHAWCDYFDDNHDSQPIACRFCRKCQDIKKCLWDFECDGEAFDIHTYNQTVSPTSSPTLPPTETSEPGELIPPEEEDMEPHANRPSKDHHKEHDDHHEESKDFSTSEDSHEPVRHFGPKSQNPKDSQDDSSSGSKPSELRGQTEPTTAQSSSNEVENNIELFIAQVLLLGFALGATVVGLCWVWAAWRRKRAIRQVRKELPSLGGFRDHSSMELPGVVSNRHSLTSMDLPGMS